MLGELQMLGVRASNLLMTARAGVVPSMGTGITTVNYDGAPGQINVEEIISGAADTMQDGGTFNKVAEKIDAVGGGGYHIMSKIGIFVLIFAIMIVGCVLAFTSNANKREESKSRILWVVVGGILILGATAIVIFLGDISTGLFSE